MMWSCEPAVFNGAPLVELIFNFCSRLASPRMILDDILVATARTDADDSFFLELSHDFDDALLGGVHILDFDRAHDVHFFLHHLDRATRHVAEELLLLLIRC